MVLSHPSKTSIIAEAKIKIHTVLAKNGVKHDFTDIFGVGGRIFLKEIELPKLQRIALDVLMRQLESVDKEIEHVQK
jgi:hypothetical protein